MPLWRRIKAGLSASTQTQTGMKTTTPDLPNQISLKKQAQLVLTAAGLVIVLGVAGICIAVFIASAEAEKCRTLEQHLDYAFDRIISLERTVAELWRRAPLENWKVDPKGDALVFVEFPPPQINASDCK